MKVNGKKYTSIWIEENNKVFIIDQRWLPHEFKIVELKNLNDLAKDKKIIDIKKRKKPYRKRKFYKKTK